MLKNQKKVLYYCFSISQAANNNGEYTTRSLPRVRIDGGNAAGNGVRLRCWAAPPSITEEEAEDDIEEDAISLRALPSQGKTTLDKKIK